MRGDEEGKKRKGQKKGQRVPLGQLGFKTKVYYGIETQYRRQRIRYKAAKYGPENSKDCFMGRLRFTVNTAQLTAEELQGLGTFKGIRRQQWNRSRQIVYHSKEQLYCAICLEKEFQVPQITSCGHVFCWHCIVMHFYKSLRASSCPVCNESYELEHIVSCQTVYTKVLKDSSSRIEFTLKARRDSDNRVYDPDTLIEDLNLARVARATPQKILQLCEQERQRIQQTIKHCDDEEVRGWMEKVHSFSWERIEKAQALVAKKQSAHYYSQQHRRDRVSNGFIFSILDDKERGGLTNFYQQKSGQLVFLHPICDRFLRKRETELPRRIEEELIYWEEAEYNVDLQKKYKPISHMTINQEVDLLIVNIESHIDSQLLPELQDSLQNFRERRKEQIQRQDRESERLSVQYEEQKEYMAKLKKMEQSEFYDIRLPTTIDIAELNNNNLFPSLMETRSMPEPSQQLYVKENKKQKKKDIPTFIEGDFPQIMMKKESSPEPQGLVYPPDYLESFKSQQVSIMSMVTEQQFPSLASMGQPESTQGKRKNKKKKFVNVTEQFFQPQLDDEQR